MNEFIHEDFYIIRKNGYVFTYFPNFCYFCRVTYFAYVAMFYHVNL